MKRDLEDRWYVIAAVYLGITLFLFLVIALAELT